MCIKTSALFVLKHYTTKYNNLFKIDINKTIKQMAKSRYEYVKSFENDNNLLPNCWITVRIDGRSFHKFSEKHNFVRPNDERGLNLMNRAAVNVMKEFKDIIIAFGESDEYSFIFRKDTIIYKRRAQKILSYVNSTFSSSYVYYWKDYFNDIKLLYPPLFDARIVLYPTDTNLRDYLSWRQADVHVNNLYNTTFWALVQKKELSKEEANKRLSGTFAADKNEILFSEFGINYNNEPSMFRKGTILIRKKIQHSKMSKQYQIVLPLHEDMIGDKFWQDHPELLNCKLSPGVYVWPENQALPSLILEQLKLL